MANELKYTGLTDAQVVESREKYGENVLTPPAKVSAWKLFLQTLTGPFGHFIPGCSNGDTLVFILEIAALLSVTISCSEYFGWFGLISDEGAKVFFEPVGIIAAILLATGIAFYFEMKAKAEFAVLNQVNDDEPVQVVRNSAITTIPRREVVVGDIVMLNTGEEIPADAVLLESTSLSVDESSLTGEPLCQKWVVDPSLDNARPSDGEATFPSDHVMRGTKVMEGHAVCRVIAVGDHTENGKVFTATQLDNDVETPLDKQLGSLGVVITAVSCIIGVIVFAGRVFLYLHTDGNSMSDPHFITYVLKSIMLSVTLVVCSVPEGLPMAVTLSLALSMRRMLKTNNLVRKMHACETMGATTVICTDKTGTLTRNQMRVSVAPESAPEGFPVVEGMTFDELLAESFAVNATAHLDLSDPSQPSVLGNPTEGALLLWLHDKGIDYKALRAKAEIVAEQPFSTETKMMWTEVRKGLYIIRYIKGAPEYVCPSYVDEAAQHQAKGMRTLGFALAVYKEGEECPSQTVPMGVVAISDPVRDDVPAAVREVIDAGIRVIMVTGDSEKTAKEIGRQIGINESDVMFRARPLDKRNLVERLQKEGHIVAVTGDGTNDAPALKAAHVGLSMGDGTSVAKEASDITIIDNSFASICRAVMWGRSLYQNLQRFILFQLTVNITACVVMVVGAFMGTESPLTVTQMLWINLIMDTFAAMALASLPPNESVMRDKPRDRNAFIISRSMLADMLVMGLAFSATILAMLFTYTHGENGVMREPTINELSLIFNVFVMFQFWNLFNVRAFGTGRSFFALPTSKAFIGIATAIFGGQIAIMTVASEFFGVEPITLTQWLMTAGFTFITFAAGEVVRLFMRKK